MGWLLVGWLRLVSGPRSVLRSAPAETRIIGHHVESQKRPSACDNFKHGYEEEHTITACVRRHGDVKYVRKGQSQVQVQSTEVGTEVGIEVGAGAGGSVLGAGVGRQCSAHIAVQCQGAMTSSQDETLQSGQKLTQGRDGTWDGAWVGELVLGADVGRQ